MLRALLHVRGRGLHCRAFCLLVFFVTSRRVASSAGGAGILQGCSSALSRYADRDRGSGQVPHPAYFMRLRARSTVAERVSPGHLRTSWASVRARSTLLARLRGVPF